MICSEIFDIPASIYLQDIIWFGSRSLQALANMIHLDRLSEMLSTIDWRP